MHLRPLTHILPVLILLMAALLLTGEAFAAEPKPRQKPSLVVGWVENVGVGLVDTVMKAKLDTGARTSSIMAEVIDVREEPPEEGSKKKRRTVIFSVEGEDGQIRTLERRLIRWVRIKKKDEGYMRRPVVIMEFCIAGREVKDEVNLADRSNFIYPLLIGRNMLRAADLVIDPSRTFTRKPRCDSNRKTD